MPLLDVTTLAPGVRAWFHADLEIAQLHTIEYVLSIYPVGSSHCRLEAAIPGGKHLVSPVRRSQMDMVVNGQFTSPPLLSLLVFSVAPASTTFDLSNCNV